MEEYKYRLIDAKIGGFATILFNNKEEMTFGPLAKIELVTLRQSFGAAIGYARGSFLRLTSTENKTAQNEYNLTEVKSLLDELGVEYFEVDEPTSR
ncbi:hypothetical protein IFU39_16670 [Paenibacillus sp. CFBP 13594]|uniref:hypothetical protein n=1 Tax=Paenibacillus sp. CFBP 13594 TaxID=2774037 RepID=UPI001784DA5E|nr:hypothetical protein [Paenibacillus sp. CFBP 13594]MBD8839448.1 hypothetical protein [Paenibacillus sp. CFBP 13594]